MTLPDTSPIRTGWRMCVLCGAEGYDCLPSLAKLKVPVVGASDPSLNGAYQTFVRCKDARACRGRCEAQGDEWPLDDTTPRYQFVGEDPR